MALCLWPSVTRAQEGPTLADIAWQVGPQEGSLGDIATIAVPDGYVFAPRSEMKKFMTITENIHTGDEMGVLMPIAEEEQWFVIFEFDEIGYVEDSERDQLDADRILESIREGTEAANKERRKRGWQEMHIDGWAVTPNYDVATHNLQWAIIGSSPSGRTINHSTRLLGRRGVMSADLVVPPEEHARVTPTYQALLGGHTFVQGHRYAEFIKGDQVAAVGLTALVAGGAGVALAKSGFFAKFLKPILIGILALFAAVWRRLLGFLRGLMGRDETIGQG